MSKTLLIMPYHFEWLFLSIAMRVSKRTGSPDLQDNPMRLAMSRRNCTESHTNHIIEIFEDLAEIKNQLSIFEIMSQPKLIRDFNCHFKPLSMTHAMKWPLAPSACHNDEYSDHADRPTTAKRLPAITKLIILWVCAGKSNWLTFTPAYSHKKWIGIQMALLITSFSPVSMAKLSG